MQNALVRFGGCALLILVLLGTGLAFTPYWGVGLAVLGSGIAWFFFVLANIERSQERKYPSWFYGFFLVAFVLFSFLFLGTGGQSAAERDVTSTYVAFGLAFACLAAAGYTVVRWRNMLQRRNAEAIRIGGRSKTADGKRQRPSPGTDLVQCVLRGDRPGLQSIADAELPMWPISSAIISTAQELLELRLSGSIAEQAGVPPSLVDLLVEEVNEVAQVIAPITNRVAAVAAQNLPPGRLEEPLAKETQKIESIQASVMALRDKLGALTLAGSDKEQVEDITVRVRQLGELADELAVLESES